MPLEIFLSVGEDEFKATGDFTIDQAVPAIKEWGRLIGLPPGQEDLDKLVEKLKTNNDGLAAVIASTPTPTENT